MTRNTCRRFDPQDHFGGYLWVAIDPIPDTRLGDFQRFREGCLTPGLFNRDFNWFHTPIITLVVFLILLVNKCTEKQRGKRLYIQLLL